EDNMSWISAIPILLQNENKWVYYLPSVLLNMTLTGSVAVLCVLLLRLIFRKAPKTVTFLLWAVVVFRLICPVSFSLPVSLYSVFETDIRDETVIEYVPTDIVFNPYPKVTLPVPDEVNDAINHKLPYGAQQVVADPLEGEAALFTEIWIFGAAIFLAWNLTEYAILRWNLRHAVKREKGIYETSVLDTAIVVGLIRPRIYLPAGLEDDMRDCVTAHEREHIRRLDMWFKFLFFIALCIHWYNPLVWIGFRFAVRDMEMACDEGVLRRAEDDMRQHYAATLLSVTAGRTIRISQPIAFGETDVKTRIKNILAYAKPAKWLAVTALLLVLAVTAVLASNPVKKDDVYEASYKVAGTLNFQEMTNSEPYRVTVTESGLIVSDDAKTVLHQGDLLKTDFLPDDVRDALEEKLRRASAVYRVRDNDISCYLIETTAGELYLATLFEGKRGIYLLEPNREEPDELYFLAMIESYGGPRAQLMDIWQTEKFLTGETWYIVGYRMQGTVIYFPEKEARWQMGYAAFCMKDGQYEMTANRRYPMEEILPGVMLCDDPASLSVDYTLAKESYDVLFILDDSVKQIDQKLDGADYSRVWTTSAPAMLVLPYKEKGISYTVTYADGSVQTCYRDGDLAARMEALQYEITELKESCEYKRMQIEEFRALIAKAQTDIVELDESAALLSRQKEQNQSIVDDYLAADEAGRTKLGNAYKKAVSGLEEKNRQLEYLAVQRENRQNSIAAHEKNIALIEAQLEEMLGSIAEKEAQLGYTETNAVSR
ncbi:MAG: hypothetical protein IJX93_07560, partial [Clostridia bacterium]|nr:hypothetical protein [Clostridia bacterium]